MQTSSSMLGLFQLLLASIGCIVALWAICELIFRKDRQTVYAVLRSVSDGRVVRIRLKSGRRQAIFSGWSCELQDPAGINQEQQIVLENSEDGIKTVLKYGQVHEGHGIVFQSIRGEYPAIELEKTQRVLAYQNRPSFVQRLQKDDHWCFLFDATAFEHRICRQREWCHADDPETGQGYVPDDFWVETVKASEMWRSLGADQQDIVGRMLPNRSWWHSVANELNKNITVVELRRLANGHTQRRVFEVNPTQLTKTPGNCRGLFCFFKLFLFFSFHFSRRNDMGEANVFEGASKTAHAALGKLDNAISDREQGVIFAHTDIGACANLGTALTHDDVANFDSFTSVQLYAKTLTVGITAIRGRTTSFFMCHKGVTIMRIWRL